MNPGANHPARRLSLWCAVALGLQAAGGLFIPGLYRDNRWVTSTFFAADINALLVDVPVLLLSMHYALRGSARARLAWLGALYYIFYNNLYFLFGAAYNRFFLVYAAISVLSSLALVATLMATDPAGIMASDSGVPRRTVGSIMLGSAGILAMLWIGQSLLYVFTGQLPQIIADTGGTTHLVASLDLSAIVPLMVIGGLWLWKGHPWGYIISGAMLFQGLLITLDLLLTAPLQAYAHIPGAWTMLPIWGAMFLAFLAGWVLLSRNLAAG